MTYKSAREIFSENLTNALKKSTMDQKDLAAKIGVSPASVTNWLKGDKYPRIDKIQKISEVLNIPQSKLTAQVNEEEEIYTVAAHMDDDLTEEEIMQVQAYIAGLKANRK